MDELDAIPLSSVVSFGGFYELPNGTRTGSFGGYVRAQFELALFQPIEGCQLMIERLERGGGIGVHALLRLLRFASAPPAGVISSMASRVNGWR